MTNPVIGGPSQPVHITGSDVTLGSSSSGGTQYTEGDTDTTIVGTALLWEDASNTLRAVSASKPLPTAESTAAYSTDTTLHTGATATGNGTAIDVSGMAAVGFQVTLNSGTATLIPEGTVDGTTWNTIGLTDFSTGAVTQSITATGMFQRRVAGLKQIRLRISAISGTVTAVAHATTDGSAGHTPVSLSVKSTLSGDTTLLGDAANGLFVSSANAVVRTATLQSAAAATGNGTSLDVSGMAVAVLQTAGTFVGTVTFEASVDDSNWVALIGEKLDSGSISPTIGVTNAVLGFRVAGFKSVRARVSAYTSGSITVTGRAQAVDAQLPLTQAVLYTATGTAIASATGTSDSLAVASTGLLAQSEVFLYDGASAFNRQRNNNDATVLASAARTATINSADQTNYNGRSLRVDIDITAISGTPSVVFSIQLKDALSGAYVTVLSSAAQTGTGHVQLQYGAGAATVANLSAPGIVGRLWRVVATHADAQSMTYSIGASTNV